MPQNYERFGVKIMTVLNVPDMHCESCVARIEKSFAEAGIENTVSLADKTVTVKEDAKVMQAIEELDDLGFDAKIK